LGVEGVTLGLELQNTFYTKRTHSRLGFEGGTLRVAGRYSLVSAWEHATQVISYRQQQ